MAGWLTSELRLLPGPRGAAILWWNMNRMLINATQLEELRVALVTGQYLYDLDIERPGQEQKKANIYKGKITRIEPSLEAAFVEYGGNRHGFLPLKEISPDYFLKQPRENERLQIRELVKENQEVMVQVDKEERGNKGAALTTLISLAGCYLVLMPNNPRAGGISRRIEGDDRTEMRDILSQLNVPEDMGLIVRTAGVGKEIQELQWDLDVLLKQWEAIRTAYSDRPAPFLIHQESNVIVRAIRDYLRESITEILVDNPDVHAKVLHHVKQIRPDFVERVKLYTGEAPLFSRFQIEKQIESAFQREVRLPSGGAIVIDHTEALLSVDINSSKATKGGDIEETALNTNLEAADEVARQLRLRDLGGLVVIDFIDMSPIRNQREVENRLRDALRMDRARVQIGRISRFGLLEMSRQRLRPSLGESNTDVCPRCTGQGYIRGVESLGFSIIRLIQEEAMKDKQAWKHNVRIRVVVPVSIGTFLLNEKRDDIHQLETNHGVKIIIIPNQYMETPHYQIERVTDEKDDGGDSASYKQAVLQEQEEQKTITEQRPQLEKPAVRDIPNVPKPNARTKGVFKRLLNQLFGASESSSSATSGEPKQPNTQRRPTQQRRGGQQSRGAGGGKHRNQSSSQGQQRRKPQGQQGQRRNEGRTQSSGEGRARSGEGRAQEGQQQGHRQQGQRQGRQGQQRRQGQQQRRDEGQQNQERQKPPSSQHRSETHHSEASRNEPRRNESRRNESRRNEPRRNDADDTKAIQTPTPSAAPVKQPAQKNARQSADRRENKFGESPTSQTPSAATPSAATPSNEARGEERQQRHQSRAGHLRRGNRRGSQERNSESSSADSSESSQDNSGNTETSNANREPRQGGVRHQYRSHQRRRQGAEGEERERKPSQSQDRGQESQKAEPEIVISLGSPSDEKKNNKKSLPENGEKES